jgi:hypothetical protein
MNSPTEEEYLEALSRYLARDTGPEEGPSVLSDSMPYEKESTAGLHGELLRISHLHHFGLDHQITREALEELGLEADGPEGGTRETQIRSGE